MSSLMTEVKRWSLAQKHFDGRFVGVDLEIDHHPTRDAFDIVAMPSCGHPTRYRVTAEQLYSVPSNIIGMLLNDIVDTTPRSCYCVRKET